MFTKPIMRAAIAVALVLVIVLGLQVKGCMDARREAAALKVQGAQAEAGAVSAADAIGAAGEVNQREREADALTRTNEKEIRNAQGADVRVDDRATAAGLDGLCRRAAYRDTARCRMRGAAPR